MLNRPSSLIVHCLRLGRIHYVTYGRKVGFFIEFQIAISPLLFGAKESSWYQDASTLRDLSIAQDLVSSFHRKGRTRIHPGRHNSQPLLQYVDVVVGFNVPQI